MQTIVDAKVYNNLSVEERALALQQAVLHPLARSIAKSAGLVHNNDFMIKNMKNMKITMKLALKINSSKG